MSVKLRQAKIEDVESIITMLKRDGEINVEKTKKLYTNPWKSSENYIGYLIEDNNKIVGFLCYLFSDRIINSKTINCCNISGWFVEKNYRKEHKLKVLEPLLDMDNYTIFGLSPTPAAYKLERRLGMKMLEDSYYIIPPIINPFNLFRESEIITKQSEFKNILNAIDLKIFSDHKEFISYKHLIIKIGEEYIYLIIKPVKRKRLLFADIYYISKLDIFLDNLSLIRNAISIRLKYAGLIIEERFLKGRNYPFMIKQKLPIPNIYLSSGLDRHEIDYLYSERFILY